MNAATTTHVVRFEPDGITIPCAEDESVGAAARRAGLRLFLGCERGGCGICRVHVAGEAHVGRVSRSRLSEDEQAAGASLACRTYPRGGLVVRRESGAPFGPISGPSGC